MEWAIRFGCIAIGAAIALVALWLHGPSPMSGDFAANVSGAAVGGFISVGLALWISGNERRSARLDAVEFVKEQRKEAIRQSLRHIRTIRDCINDGVKITINNSQNVRSDILSSVSLAKIALQDNNLTDFPLRRAMERTIQLGNSVATTLIHELDKAKLQDANLILPKAIEICEKATLELQDLMDKYADLRAVPAL